MNKRSKSLASIFATRPAESELSADNSPRTPRVSAGSVRSMKESFSQVERENEALRQSLTEGARIVEIDPALVDPSPFADRFVDEKEDRQALEALRASIEESGQEIPVLLRVHTLDPARYETAFGHRRVRVARMLKRPVRAIVREMDDEALALAQGIENSARQDLTFIERAFFALRLETSGRSRATIQQALSVDKAEVSKLLAIAKAVPERVRRYIGRAPKVGRFRWQALVAALEGEGALWRIDGLIADFERAAPDSDSRFAAVLAAASDKRRPKARQRSILGHSGLRIATYQAKGDEMSFVVDKTLGSHFADFLAERLPALYEDYAARHGGPTPPRDETPRGKTKRD